MTTTPTPTGITKKPRHIPGCWGTSAVAFYERHEDELVTAHFLDATCPPLSGRLVGVDQYDIFLEVAGDTVLVCKHAIRYLAPGAADRVCPCPPSPSAPPA